MLGKNGRAYAFAQSGVPLSQYVAYAQHACAVYRPQKLVVVVVGNDFDESVFEHRLRDGIYHLYPLPDGSFDYRFTPLPEPGPIERVLRHSALALYLARNVGITNMVDWFRPSAANAQTDMSATPPPPPIRRASMRDTGSLPGFSMRCRRRPVSPRMISHWWSMHRGRNFMIRSSLRQCGQAISSRCARG